MCLSGHYITPAETLNSELCFKRLRHEERVSKVENENQTKKGFCEIKVKGKLEQRWAEWFDLMNIETQAETTVISGFVTDQPALQGLMEKISMLGLTVISIKFVNPKEENYEELY